MPRRDVVRPLGAKPNAPGMKRKNAPGRYKETTENIELLGTKATDGKKCAYSAARETATGNEKVVRCQYEATEYVRFAWFCKTHAPKIPDTCEHLNPSYLWGRLVCCWCGFDHGPIPEKTP